MPIFGPAEPSGRFTVLLAAWSAEEAGLSDLRSVLERQEALISLARAVFGIGGRIALPADGVVAPFVADLGVDYATAPGAERREVRDVEPVLVVETEESDERLREDLARPATRGAVRYVDSAWEPVMLRPRAELADDETDALDGRPELRRQPVTQALVERAGPVLAVVVSPSMDAVGEVDTIRSAGVDVAAFAVSEHLRERFREYDRTEELLSRFERDHRRREWQPERQDRPPVPYAFLMQRLVSSWADPERHSR